MRKMQRVAGALLAMLQLAAGCGDSPAAVLKPADFELAFVSDRDGSGRHFYVMKGDGTVAPDGTGLRRLTNNPPRGSWLESYDGAWRPRRR